MRRVTCVVCAAGALVIGGGGCSDEPKQPVSGGEGGVVAQTGGAGGLGLAGAAQLQGGSAGAGLAGEPNLAESGAGGQAVAGDLPRDILDTALEVNLATRRALATITLGTSTSSGASFEIGDLEIVSITREGEALDWQDLGSTLEVEVPPSASPLVIVIDYEWRLHERSDGISRDGYTMTWPYYCGNVFPCHSSPADGTTFRLSLTGMAEGQTAIYASEIGSDAPPYMAAWIVGDYTELSLGKTDNGTNVSLWYLPGGRTAAQAGGRYLVQAFDWLEQNLGPYRFGDRVSGVAAPWGEGAVGGMEHHPNWHIAADSMNDQALQIHEAAHGWFGNGVRLRCWEDLVLSEGTVTYLAARILEQVAGADVSDPLWLGYEQELARFRRTERNRIAWPQSCGVVDVLNDGPFTRSTYIKGAFFYRGVEQKVGLSALDEALRTFYTRYAGKAASMRDMLDVIAEVTGYDAGPCAEAWLVDPGAAPQPSACP